MTSLIKIAMEDIKGPPMEANGGAANQVAAVAQIKGVLSCGCVKP
jgi:hypothetical protein